MTLKDKERYLLDLLQEEIPLKSRPFAYLGEKIGLTETEVLEILHSLKKRGILRHLGASPDSRRLGFVTTLVATAVPPTKAEEVAREIARYPQVTHCYLRKHKLNIWFTLVARDFEEIETFLKILSQKIGIKFYHFPAQKIFKLRATFKL